MTAHLYQFAANREAELLPSGKNIAAIEELPLVSAELLDGMFERLSTEDKKLALQNKIIPVACLPKMTLHGAAGHAARVAAEAAGLHIIAQIDPIDFARAIRRKLGKEVLAKAANALRIKNPTGSAHRRFTPQQTFWAAALVVLMAYVYNCMRPEIFYAGASLICGIFFLTVISLRVLCLFENKSAQTSPALVLTVDELPVYSILVPVFRETQVLNQLIASLSHLNYPRAKLDIKLILEETDIQMQRAVAALVLPEYFDVIVVPTGKPQTKPRALNYALQFARGTLLTIYDAEDVPEPLQLRKAAAQFAAAPASLACLQAELAFYNANENWLTRQFTIEYATLFKMIMPALVAERLPVLLGGTSNHFRVSVLREVGGWDPYNVTEDADLGLRLARAGLSTGVLDSITYEEATSALTNWLWQRSRWLKGFIQTWLVQMRSPTTFWNNVGGYGFWTLQATTLGLIISALFHPFLLIHAIYMMASGQFIDIESNMMVAIASINLVVFFAGYGFSIWAGYKALHKKQIKGWWMSLVTMPAYWMLVSIAGWMALWQFVFRPHYWNKTNHGLSRFQQRQ